MNRKVLENRTPKKGRLLDPSVVSKALDEQSNTGISNRKISEKYNISVSSILKYKKLMANKSYVDSPNTSLTTSMNWDTVFTETEEDMFLENFLVLADADILLNEAIIRTLIQAYLTSQKRTVEGFHSGTYPTEDWLTSFVSRHRYKLPKVMWTENNAVDKLHDHLRHLKDIYNDNV